MHIDDNSTLREVKRFLRETRKDPGGTHCPACTQHYQEYKRFFTGGMARSLIWLLHVSEKFDDDYIHVERKAPPEILNVRSWDKIEAWGCVIRAPNDDDSKRCSGLWKITDKGRAFAQGRIQVWEHGWFLMGKPQAWSIERRTVREALGKKFNYEELMNPIR